jgi:hypothetical protein
MRFVPVGPLLLILFAVMAGPALAQAIRGRVLEQGTTTPVWTAFVVLLDEQGVQRGAALTDTTGHFFIRAPAPGNYMVRIERIGHGSTLSPALEIVAGRILVHHFEVPIEPIVLDGISASSTRRCRIPRELGVETQLLWDEARKALAIAAWIEGDRGVPYQTFMYERTRSVLSLEIREQSARLRSGYGRTPFYSESARDLATHGYIRSLGGNEYQYLGVDAPTLLSDAFLDTHCFRVREPESGNERLIGLAFEPIPTRELPDITGVLWLDRATNELRSLEFEYTEHQYTTPTPSKPFGGQVEFRRLVNGAWIVERWWLRMPQFPTTTLGQPVISDSRTTDREHELLAAAHRRGLRVREEGGEVRYIVEPGEVVHGNAAVEGVVYDSTRARPLSGATVFLTTARHTTRTDADGRFRMTRLPTGTHEIAFIHPYADSLGLRVQPRPIVLTSGEYTRTELFIPRGTGCPAPAIDNESTIRADAGMGAVAGVVYDATEGRPVAGVRVVAEWRSLSTNGRGFRGDPRSRSVRTDDEGRFVLCALPVGSEIQLVASGKGFRETVKIRIEAPGLIREDFLVR